MIEILHRHVWECHNGTHYYVKYMLLKFFQKLSILHRKRQVRGTEARPGPETLGNSQQDWGTNDLTLLRVGECAMSDLLYKPFIICSLMPLILGNKMLCWVCFFSNILIFKIFKIFKISPYCDLVDTSMAFDLHVFLLGCGNNFLIFCSKKLCI